MSNRPKLGVSGIEVISYQDDWIVTGKKIEQNGKYVISEICVRPSGALVDGGLTATAWRKIRVNDLLGIMERTADLTDKVQKEFLILSQSILKLVREENLEIYINYVRKNWDRRGRVKQPDKVYAYLAVLYVLFNFLDRKKPITFLSESLDIPKRTLISRINTCYELDFLERKVKYGYSVGKYSIRWTDKTSVILKKDNLSIVNYLSKLFQKDIGKSGVSL